MNRLKELRLSRGLLQSDIAKIIKKSERTVGFYESGERDMGTETLSILSDFFNVSIDYLLGKDSTDEPIEIAASTENHIDIADLPDSAKEFIKDIVNKYKNLKKEG